jgi:hypothetical protein
MTVVSSIGTILLSRETGVQELHEGMEIWSNTIQKRENVKGQILLR